MIMGDIYAMKVFEAHEFTAVFHSTSDMMSAMKVLQKSGIPMKVCKIREDTNYEFVDKEKLTHNCKWPSESRNYKFCIGCDQVKGCRDYLGTDI